MRIIADHHRLLFLSRSSCLLLLGLVSFSGLPLPAHGATSVQTITIKPDESRITPSTDKTLAPIKPTDPATLKDDPKPKAVDPEDPRPIPAVLYDVKKLPAPVLNMRARILAAARSGDLKKLLPVLQSNEMMPSLSLTPIDDPLDFLKESSGDTEGHEILAILAETLESGFAHVEKGTPQEMYVWPYFARYPLHKLSPQQRVELFKIITPQDLADMETIGTYTFYRLGISPDGTWHFFLAGE